MVRKNISAQFQTDLLQYKKPALVFHFDLDTLAGENEEYEFVWEKIELALIFFLKSLAHSDKKSILQQKFYLWGEISTTINSSMHLCNAYFVYIIPETDPIEIEISLSKSLESIEVPWGIEEVRSLNEECIPLFKYEGGDIIRYVFDQITENGQEDLGCAKIMFTTWDEDWHISPGAYSIDMMQNITQYYLSDDEKVKIVYRKFRLIP